MINKQSATSLRFITCGSVDDGKSTLIGHLLYSTNNLSTDQIETLKSESQKFGNAGNRLDYSLLLDGLLAEREQGITIDVAYRYFSSSIRKFIVADTPGHEQYTRNMATAASNCDAALVLIDARQGVLAQTRRHTLICALMGIPTIAFIINKMDLCDNSETIYNQILAQCQKIITDLGQCGIKVPNWSGLPLSALQGDNLIDAPKTMPWFKGPSLLEWLNTTPSYQNNCTDSRFAVQYVIKPGIDKSQWQNLSKSAAQQLSSIGNVRLYAGRILSGQYKVGDDIYLLPSGLRSKIAGIIDNRQEVDQASSGSAIAFRLADQLDISRGEGLFLPASAPAISDQFKVQIVWMSEEPLLAGRKYQYQSIYGIVQVQVSKILSRLDLEHFQHLATELIQKNDIAELEIKLNQSIPFDPYNLQRESGSFLLMDKVSNVTAAAGIIVHSLRRADNVHWQKTAISKSNRATTLFQQPKILWFTGLSGSGKSTIASLLEIELNKRGKHTMLLDGDNIRHGLCNDLGFTEADRVENIRRVGEVSKLMLDAGLIVLACFISPYRADRQMVRDLVEKDEFVEIHVATSLAICESRDPKGLYKKARNQQIPNFTGISAPYEAPEQAEITIQTANQEPSVAVDQILKWLQ